MAVSGQTVVAQREAQAPGTAAGVERPGGRGRLLATLGAWALVAAPLTLFLAGAVYLWSYVVDDAYINARYAWELVHGAGLVYSPGQRVQGFTDPLLVLLEAGALWLRVGDPVFWAKLMGMVSGLGLLWLLRPRKRASTVIVPLLAATSVPILVWSVGGLDTLPFTVLIVAGIALCTAGDWRGYVPLGLAPLVRPEGFLFLCVFSVLGLWRKQRTAVPLAWLPALAYEGWATLYYGTPIPSTLLAKQASGSFLQRARLAALSRQLPHP